MWRVLNRGFLPEEDPVEYIVFNDPEYTPLVFTLENLSSILPTLMEDRRVREELVHQLRSCAFAYQDAFVPKMDRQSIERAMVIYSYLASAYIFAKDEAPAKRLPKEIAIPLVRLANRTGRKPILSYASYCLYNWRRIDPEGPIALGNIELLQNFSQEGKRDEDWFILVHVEIEAAAAQVLARLDFYDQILQSEEPPEGTETFFSDLLESLQKMNAALSRMPEQCDPDKYFRLVRPYIWSFEDVVYEALWDNQPQTLRGETGAQSSIVPAICAILGIRHEDNMLTKHLGEMRLYMPFEHRNFLERLENRSSERNLRTLAVAWSEFRPVYNACVQELAKFRTQHFEYAVEYIMKRVENPKGTGGTPYGPWLRQLRDETESHVLK